MLPSLWNNDDNWISHLNVNSGILVSENDKYVHVSVNLPGINPKNIDASYDDDCLKIKFAKSPKAQPKKITVKSV